MKCELCPRKCRIDRSKGNGFCGVGSEPKVAKAYLHMWEEPCLVGDNGSGTIFFSGCNLRCVFCQNYQISSEGFGKSISVERLAEIFKELEQRGAININLVSPSHYVDAIIGALQIYRPSIPVVYNSNGYDSLETLDRLKDYVDIFLVDFKYMDSELSKRLSNAEDYAEVAKASILKVREMCPIEEYDENGVMKKGVIIRHLIMPNHTNDSIEILRWIKDNVDNPTISLMGQYTPMYKASEHEDINRPLKPIEYKRVSKAMIDIGLCQGYLQELTSATEEYTPIWDYEGI